MKRYSVLVLLLTLQNYAFGQSAEGARRWRFGVMTGPQFGMLVPKNADTELITGITATADLSYALQNSRKGWALHFQPGIARSVIKRTEGTEGSEYYMKWKSQSTTINLPLLVRYTLLEGKVRPFADLGTSYLALNYWSMKGAGQFCQNGGCYPNDFDGKGSNDIDRGRFSALAGVGMELDFGKVIIPVTVRWIEQLRKIERIDDITTGIKYTLPRTRTIQVSAGILF